MTPLFVSAFTKRKIWQIFWLPLSLGLDETIILEQKEYNLFIEDIYYNYIHLIVLI